MSKAAAPISYTPEDLDYLLSPRAIRERCKMIFNLALAGQTHFRVRPENLGAVAQFVTETTLGNYPTLEIPFHSRWGHFQAGNVDRLSELSQRLRPLSPLERARAKLDLVIVSVLLDAGSGPGWKYLDASTGQAIARSEGLAVASLRMFLDGAFSSDPKKPCRADADQLTQLKAQDLEKGFQVSGTNPLVGVEGRLRLLHELGRAAQNDPTHFPAAPGESSRPGNLADHCARLGESLGASLYASPSKRGRFTAETLLLVVLKALGPIWPGRIQLGTTHLGDVWSHPLLGDSSSTKSLIPFHKLSQWLTYSLIEPLEESGIDVADVQGLTGLAEYRNGGLLLDRGLIELRDPSLLQRAHPPDSQLIIEWRALTVVLLDEIAKLVRSKLHKTEAELPLVKVLEGGTWWAGRKAASELRSDGAPPLKIISDGTVF